jgi:hypothetical protein
MDFITFILRIDMGIILGIVALILVIRLGYRVDMLEATLSERKSTATGTPTSVAQDVASQPTSIYAPPQSYTTQSITLEPSAVSPPVYVDNTPSPFVAWIQEDILMKIGGLFLLMALGWFVSYAFANNWIGPAGRIALGLGFGASILALGVWRIRTHEHQGAVFAVLGSTTVILTVAAGRALYEFFTPLSALGLMFLSILFVTFMSLQYKRNSLALASLILAAIAPHFALGFDHDIMQKFYYLFTITIGTLWVVYATGWRNLTLTALVIVFFETLPYMSSYNEKTLVLMWVFLFVATFFIANIVSIIRVNGEALSSAHLSTAFGTALFLILWVFTVAPQESQSLLFVFWMLVFSFGAYIAYRTTDNRIPFYVYGGASMVLLGAATAAEFEGPVLTIAYTLEVAAMVLVSEFANLERKAVTTLSILFAIPLALSVESLVSPAWRMGVLHGDLFVLVILGLALTITGLYINECNRMRDIREHATGSTLLIFGAIYGLWLIWLVLHALIGGDVATMLALIIYTILGLSIYATGRSNDTAGLRTCGGFLIGIVVARLLLIEVWQMALTGKIITFLAIGILLISTAFVKKGGVSTTQQITPQ